MYKLLFRAVTAAATLTLLIQPAVARADMPASMDLVTHNGVLVQASAAAVWPFILDPGKWKAGAQMVAVGGPKGKQGELFKAVMPNDQDTALFFIKNVELVPQRRRTIRLTTPEGALIGFATWELTAQDNATLVEYHVYSTSFLPAESAAGMTAAQIEAAEAEGYAANHQRFGAELEAMKKLVESSQK